jgi:uncharacterized protein YggE
MMSKSSLALLLLTCCAIPSWAQIVSSGRSTVSASGQASVSVPPDQAMVDVTVTAQGATAQAASSKDADQVTSVLAALTKLLGAGADIKTVNYFVGANYNNSGQTIVGYTASSTLEVTLTNLSLAGTVIDTAVAAGATSVGGVQFSLQNSDPAHQQALKLAALQAKAHADAMASALSHVVGPIISLAEAGSTPVTVFTGVAGAPSGTTTPVVPGLIQIEVTVNLQAELD